MVNVLAAATNATAGDVIVAIVLAPIALAVILLANRFNRRD